jgi:hypothetical protein
MQQHDRTQRADTETPTLVHSPPPASRELLEAMEQVVSHFAVLCREVEALLSQSGAVRVEKSIA